MIKRLLFVTSLAVLGGCGTTAVGLRYSAPAQVQRVSANAQPLAVDVFSDQRGEPANWLGAIRGGFGNPLKNLESDKPVAQLVATAFADGLKARGMTPATTGTAPARLAGVVKKLDCNQVVRREANVEVDLSVRNSAGQVLFAKTYRASRLDGSIVSLSTGVLASVDDLRATLELTLREVVDKALDDPELRAALRI